MVTLCLLRTQINLTVSWYNGVWLALQCPMHFPTSIKPSDFGRKYEYKKAGILDISRTLSKVIQYGSSWQGTPHSENCLCSICSISIIVCLAGVVPLRWFWGRSMARDRNFASTFCINCIWMQFKTSTESLILLKQKYQISIWDQRIWCFF